MFIKRESVAPFDFDGLSIRDYTADKKLGSSLAEIVVPAGVRHKVSWSTRSDKYYYVVQGDLVFNVNGGDLDLSSGDVCIVPKGDRFYYRNDGPGEARLILVHTPGFKLECEMFED